MARSQKSKRVSWPPDVNLCQVIDSLMSFQAPLFQHLRGQQHPLDMGCVDWMKLLVCRGVLFDDTCTMCPVRCRSETQVVLLGFQVDLIVKGTCLEIEKRYLCLIFAPDPATVRLFLSEDAPSLSGSGSQDHLQAKTSWMLHSMGAGTDDHLPPGFEAAQQSTPRIPIIKWCCPPTLLLSPSWQVVAGEESKEVEAQTQREMRVLEAVYPRPSAIPPNSSVSPDALSYQHGDVGTPLVPITPVEDDDSVDQSDPSPSIGLFETSELQRFSKSVPDTRNLHPPRDTRGGMPEKSHVISTPPNTDKSTVEISSAAELDVVAAATAAEPDVVAAATAAFTAIMRTNEAGSLIDRDLLIKILSNPQLIDHLVKDYGTPAPSIQMTTNPVSNPVTASVTMPVSSQSVHINRPESSSTSTATPLPTSTFTQPAVSGHFHPLTNTVAPALTMRPPLASASTMTTSPVVKDINYYKSLIQQHGEEKPETQFGKRLSYHNLGLSMETIQQQNPKARDSRGKIQKPCIYFNTPKGCRHGVNCAYQHDASFQQRVASIPEVQSAKRMKLEGEITGRS